MKKFFILLIPFTVLVSLILLLFNSKQSFSDNQNTNYLKVVQKQLLQDTPNIKIIENKFFTTKTVDSKNKDFFLEMLNSIKFDHAISSPNDVKNLDELFKIHIKIKEDKYILDIYGHNIISLYPWDGNKEKDFFDLSSLPNSINPELLCDYIFKNQT